MNNELMDKALDWDDEVNETEYELIPAGIYNFVVRKFERGNHSGSTNLPACKKAILTLDLTDDTGKKKGTVTHSLYLHTKCSGFLSAFFLAIGEKENNGKVKMNWNNVTGASGRLEIFIDKYNGEEYAKVKKFLKPAKAQPSSNAGYDNF